MITAQKWDAAQKRAIFQQPDLDLQLLCIIRSLFDYSERYVTAFWPINGAPCSWSYYNNG